MDNTPTPMILIISGDDEWRASCARQLITSGCDVHTACDGFRGIDDLRKHQYGAVVFDDTLPDVSSFELHLNIRDIARNTPREFIAMGKNTAARTRDRLGRNGEHVYVGTPQEILERLLPAIRNMTAGNGEKSPTN